ncbi:hypothetical protein HYU12_05145 [Candidatus Woesearchaeota archaeon]|nr:hypothetical protein [Candidatus Woesearchaeota archaeon]
MPEAYTVEGDVIFLHREMTELDCFVRKFLDVLTKHTDYLIVSGYVSIATGRTRATEDVDILVPLPDKPLFNNLFKDLTDAGFWCYQGDTFEEVYQYIKEKQRIRFALKHQLFPNIEFIPINEKDTTKLFEFSHPQKMRIADFRFKTPPIEFEILYKERILGSGKDFADASHLRTIFSGMLTEKKFKKFEPLVMREPK